LYLNAIILSLYRIIIINQLNFITMANSTDTKNLKIIDVDEFQYPKNITDTKMPEVVVRFEDGSKKRLFSFYPDEVFFLRSEIIGKTEEEVRELRRQKDVQFLQS